MGIKTKFQNNWCKIALVCCLIMSLTLAGCFTGWDKKDKALFGGFVGLNIVDTYQTFDAFDDPNKKELNPLMQNKASVVLIKLGGNGNYLLDS